MNVFLDHWTGRLSSRFRWCVHLSPDVSRRIRDYKPCLPHRVWDPVADLVRATVAAAAPATSYEVKHLLHAVGRLAVWADGSGLPRDPAVWLRTETIDRFVLSGCADKEGSTAQTYATWLRRTREALVWVERGEAPHVRLSSSRDPHPPYERGELARLRAWADALPGQARRDGLAMMALGAGCGCTPGELTRMRGSHIRFTHSGKAVLDKELIGRRVVCRMAWEDVLADLAHTADTAYLFRPRRKVEASKNLVSSWPARHRPSGGLPRLSARRLRSTWIVELLRERIDPAVVAMAAGMKSPAGLAAYHRWVPPIRDEEVDRLLRGRRQ
ncbi:hypothetical protein [Streptomyces sp. 6N223]|uniref:hypothetical protein n=1 Tax=Streptomyces sp. 6N223 TaxID=3457412 RepID=UPI003FD58524